MSHKTNVKETKEYENPVSFDDMVRQLLKAKPQPKAAKKPKKKAK